MNEQRARTTGRARTVGLLGGSGGVGTSALAAGLASAAARQGLHVACADARPGGGGIDVLFDLEGRPGARWPHLAEARGRLDGAALMELLPRSGEGVSVLAAAPGAAVDAAGVRSALTALREATELLVLDLGVTDADRPIPMACDDLVLVAGYTVPALARAAAAAQALADGLAEDADRLWLVQRCPRGRGDVAEQVATRLDLPLLALLLDDPRLDAELARGRVPGRRPGRFADGVEAVLLGLVTQEQPA